LPHWSQAGTISFITWRTWDSIPESVLNQWLAARAEWLKQHGINPASDDWRTQLHTLGPTLLREFQLLVSDRWNEHLDACHGASVLRRSELSRIVADSLLHFDGQRYDLTDFIVMPNHVHLLAAFPDDPSMLKQCESWKHFTATQINRALNRKGHFWQQDGFDHLVRSLEQFEFLRQYIAANPSRAKVQPGEFVHYSKPV
jgi:type I restriction enzyme R subunit